MPSIPTLIVLTALNLGSKYDMDPNLILAITKVESAFNVNAVGASHKEVGLMQLHPLYFKGVRFDVSNNMETGVRYLAVLRKQCAGKYADAWFICYNVGANKLIKQPKRFTYYKKVMEAHAQIEATGSRSFTSNQSKVCNLQNPL
jgi:soluble lytic murein transglycosylase-like protein